MEGNGYVAVYFRPRSSDSSLDIREATIILISFVHVRRRRRRLSLSLLSPVPSPPALIYAPFVIADSRDPVVSKLRVCTARLDSTGGCAILWR